MELRLRHLVNSGLAVTRGFADDELEENLQRAQQLCRELEDEAALVSGVIGLARLQLFRANRPALEELARQEEHLTERLHDPLLLVQLQTHLVSIETVRGRHTRAEEHYQQVAGHYNSQAHRSSPSFFAEDPLVVALTSSGLSLSLAGWLDQGWSRIAQGLARAEEGAQYLVLANGLWLAVLVKSLRGEHEEAGQLAQKMDALAREHDFSLYAISWSPAPRRYGSARWRAPGGDCGNYQRARPVSRPGGPTLCTDIFSPFSLTAIGTRGRSRGTAGGE